jgi:cytochrome c oxidase cbb3-type subunit III
MLRVITAMLLGAPLVLLGSCKREERTFRVEPPFVNTVDVIPSTDFHAGGPTTLPAISNDLESNAYSLSEGKRLYNAMNCSGCHFQGGGGIGPPLMDDRWIYGSDPAQVYATILQGRPNGMPSYAKKVTDNQAWQLSAYVRSMSGLVSSTVAPSRSDHIQVRPAETSTDPQSPGQSTEPK